jgi:hypothetical protein
MPESEVTTARRRCQCSGRASPARGKDLGSAGLSEGQILLHKPQVAAARLNCSVWRLKQQAREGKIPFVWAGGYRWSEAQLHEIVEIWSKFAATAAETAKTTPARRQRRARSVTQSGNVIELQARTPARARRAAGN